MDVTRSVETTAPPWTLPAAVLSSGPDQLAKGGASACIVPCAACSARFGAGAGAQPQAATRTAT